MRYWIVWFGFATELCLVAQNWLLSAAQVYCCVTEMCDSASLVLKYCKMEFPVCHIVFCFHQKQGHCFFSSPSISYSSWQYQGGICHGSLCSTLYSGDVERAQAELLSTSLPWSSLALFDNRTPPSMSSTTNWLTCGVNSLMFLASTSSFTISIWSSSSFRLSSSLILLSRP